MSDFVSISLPENVWREVFSLIHNERQSLLDTAERVEGLYGEVLKDDAQKLGTALQEIELNLIARKK